MPAQRKRLTISLPAMTYERLFARCEEEGLTANALVNKLVYDYLELTQRSMQPSPAPLRGSERERADSITSRREQVMKRREEVKARR